MQVTGGRIWVEVASSNTIIIPWRLCMLVSGKGLQVWPEGTLPRVSWLTQREPHNLLQFSESVMSSFRFRAALKRLVLPLLALLIGVEAGAKPQLAEGMYRVDWNRKVRDLCIDAYTNDDLTARDWQAVLAHQGAICKLSDVRKGKAAASWTGICNQPGRGTVLTLIYKISIKLNSDGSFDFLTVLSGDQQATIPIHGERLKGTAARCTPESEYFRPWQ